ncbi:S8 family serine peptidase [Aliiglaciecola sp. LCG003]|uniref:S8 family serine peptidase n=1 Tax=Aliiglaciecola sp. LCG003 TaxID=3053655 RepID=UPI0025740BF7|nr:S8 family serine peptidase [Aliiglaciecola sp. LCG003]WJG10296.1 S8 family serine peptidase [Aliiglaciecola sp. LCG003]
MIKYNKSLCIKAGLTALQCTFLATSVNAAVNGPVEVISNSVSLKDSNSVTQQLSNRFALRLKDSERYIVTFKNTDSESLNSASASQFGVAMANGRLNQVNAENLIKSYGASPDKALVKHGMVAATMSKKALNLLRANPQVASISPDPKRSIKAQTTPYGITMVQAPQLAQNNLSARKVCIIDTGFNLGHSDLGDQNSGVTGQGNNAQVGNWYNDGNGHGTHVAGTISALANNQGVVGVYPGVDLHIVKIFDDSGNWTFASDIIDAIDQCQTAGANVVNMSLGGSGSSTAESNAMQTFVNQGMMLVAAAGNSGNSSLSYPASYDSVISVAAVGSNESRASYSQYNSQVEIAGPGTSVQSTWPTNTYNTISGTSMATPHVAGAAALVWSFFPQCTNEQIRSALNATAKDKGASGRDTQYGFGIVQSRDAYDYLNTFGCNGDTGGGGGGGGGGVDPVTGQLTGLSASSGAWKRYTWDVPAGVSTLTVSISGGSGDADLYMRLGAEPSTGSYDCRPYLNGNNEVCTFTNPSSGTWHIGIRAYTSFSGVTMNYSYD